MSITYIIALPDPAAARGNQPSLSFSANGAEEFAAQLGDALRNPGLFERWRALQAEPDDVDPVLAATDPQASVHGVQDDLRIVLTVTTSLRSEIFKHRLRLLAGNHWEMRDVRF